MNAINYVKKMTLLKIKSVVKVKCCSGSEQGKSGVTILNKHPLEKLFRKFWCRYFGLCFCFFFHLHLLHTCGQLLLQTFYFHRHDLSLYNFFHEIVKFCVHSGILRYQLSFFVEICSKVDDNSL